MLTLLLCLVAAPPPEELLARPDRVRVFQLSMSRFQGDYVRPFENADETQDDQIVDHFRRRGVPADQVLVLKDAAAYSAAVFAGLDRLLADSRSGETLWLYVGTHGGRNVRRGDWSFCCYDESASFAQLLDRIEAGFRGDRVIALADCCFSGGLCELVARRKSRLAWAALSSTAAQQTAYSQARFVECVLRALKGNPVTDENADCRVELAELAGYADRYLAFAAGGKPQFVATNQFPTDMILARAAGKRKPRVGELVEVQAAGRWWKAEVIDARPKQLRIHYTADTRPRDDAWVNPADVRTPDYPRHPPGTAVEVWSASDEKWYPAVVRDVRLPLHLCHYTGYPDTDDAWFAPDCVRLPSEGQSPRSGRR